MMGENHLHYQQPFHLPSVPLAVTDFQTAAHFGSKSFSYPDFFVCHGFILSRRYLAAICIMFKSFGKKKKAGGGSMSQEQIQARMQQQASKARDKIVELSKLLEMEKNEKMDLQRKFNDLENEKEELDDEVEKLNENISSLSSERDEALEDAAQAKDDCKKALADTAFANAMKENALSTIKELEGANEKLQNELNSTREELKESIKKVEGQASKLSALD